MNFALSVMYSVLIRNEKFEFKILICIRRNLDNSFVHDFVFFKFVFFWDDVKRLESLFFLRALPTDRPAVNNSFASTRRPAGPVRRTGRPTLIGRHFHALSLSLSLSTTHLLEGQSAKCSQAVRREGRGDQLDPKIYFVSLSLSIRF